METLTIRTSRGVFLTNAVLQSKNDPGELGIHLSPEGSFATIATGLTDEQIEQVLSELYEEGCFDLTLLGGAVKDDVVTLVPDDGEDDSPGDAD